MQSSGAPFEANESGGLSALRVAPDDQVAIALRSLEKGDVIAIDGRAITIQETIDIGHKVAIWAIARGSDVYRYGAPIGVATADIAEGWHVHSHNLVTKLKGIEPYLYDGPPPFRAGTGDNRWRFNGYCRADGSVGTRNQIWILPTVGCVGRTAQRIAAAAHLRHQDRVDGVVAFAHPFGCSQLGDDLDGTAQILASLACHPNAGGVLLLGLGCEENQLAALIERVPAEFRTRLRSLCAQTSLDELDEGARAIDDLAELAAQDKRREMGVAALRVGLKCGGSDGFSGLTANPLIGRVADVVTRAGGSAILTEIPEMFGAERLLMSRAANAETFDTLVGVIDDFKRYFIDHGEPISENPSLGNIAGGISTLEEKSLGAVQKGGSSSVNDVLRYGQRLRRPGLSILEAPGNDAVSTTALAAAGATLTLFSTGRGTPLGSPVPTMKLATNHALAAYKPGWIDFDADKILEIGFDAATDLLMAAICAVASGLPARNEINEEREIAIWKRGVTL